jgi:glutamate synthase (NADPH/NADH) large chain
MEGLIMVSAPRELLTQMHIAGLHQEALEFIDHMVLNASEPVGAMGNDTAPAIFSDKRRALTDLLKQAFAQITNPSIHPYTEADVMSLETVLASFFDAEGEKTDKPVIRLPSAIVTAATLNAVGEHVETVEIDCTFDHPGTLETFEKRIEEIRRQAEELARQGKHIVLTNEHAGPGRAPFEMAMIGPAVHLHLIDKGLRDQVSLHGRATEAFSPHDQAVLIGFGLDTVSSGIVEKLIAARHAAGEYGDMALEQCFENYFKAADFGVLTIMAKMGICTAASYRGAFQFEAFGLGKEYVKKFAPGVHSEIGGFELEDFYARAVRFHTEALAAAAEGKRLPHRGIHKIKQGADAEDHAISAAHIDMLQRATREEDFDTGLKIFLGYAAGKRSFNVENPTQIRDLWDVLYKKDLQHITEEELVGVEPAESIKARLGVASMSYGSTSPEQFHDLHNGAKMAGAKWMSGEGGLPPDLKTIRFVGKGIQIASGRFAIDIEVIVNGDEIEIKIAQAAKGGEGGQLPAEKVSSEIAEARNCEPGTALYSMGAHASIKSIEDLAQLVYALKQANPKARVATKLVAAGGIDTISIGAIKCGSDRVNISGTSGGTGAAKQTSQQHTSMPWEIYLPLVHRMAVEQGYREKAALSVDGGISTPQDIIIATILGGEEYYMGKLMMYVLGCRNMGICNENLCAFGNATMDPELRRNYTGKPEYVVRFFDLMAEGVRRELAALGMKSLDELRGRTDLLEHARLRDRNFDFSKILQPFPGNNQKCELKPGERNESVDPKNPGGLTIDERLWKDHSAEILDSVPWNSPAIPVTNSDRCLGTRLSSYLTTEFQGAARADHLVRLNLEGIAGQQLGFLLARGITIDLVGATNDGAGEGNSGGILIVRPKPGTTIARQPHEHSIAGNHALYGATAGEAYFSGRNGNNFSFRFSRGTWVTEGMGANGVRFATGGTGVCLGDFGPGMFSLASGGDFAIYDPHGFLQERIDQRMRNAIRPMAEIPEEERVWVRELIEKHFRYTQSPRAGRFLENWGQRLVDDFKMVSPGLLRSAAATAKKPEPGRNGLINIGGGPR